MGHRAHPTVAWRSSLAVLVVAWACATPEPFDASDVEVAPAELVRAALGPTGEPPPAELAFEFPDEGAIFVKAPVALVAGRLLAPGTGSRIDAALVIDTSGSTAEVSGADVDRDGVVGTSAARGDRDPDDSILAAEVAAARRLVQGVDLATTRVGIVRFSGYVYQSHDRYADPRSYRTRSRQSSETRAPLGRDATALDAALDVLLEEGPDGMTDMAAALDRAVAELTGGRKALSKPDPGARRMVIFLTDGIPTLPEPERPERNERMVLRAADRAAEAGVRVFSFAIGPQALERPVAVVEMARRTGGLFTPVRDPANLETAVAALSFDAFEGFTVRNVTLDAAAEASHVGADGSWEARVPLGPGRNRIEARATVLGTPCRAARTVQYAPGAAETFVPEAVAARLRRVQGGGRLDLESQRRVLEIIADDRAAVLDEAATQLRELGEK